MPRKQRPSASPEGNGRDRPYSARVVISDGEHDAELDGPALAEHPIMGAPLYSTGASERRRKREQGTLIRDQQEALKEGVRAEAARHLQELAHAISMIRVGRGSVEGTPSDERGMLVKLEMNMPPIYRPGGQAAHHLPPSAKNATTKRDPRGLDQSIPRGVVWEPKPGTSADDPLRGESALAGRWKPRGLMRAADKPFKRWGGSIQDESAISQIEAVPVNIAVPEIIAAEIAGVNRREPYALQSQHFGRSKKGDVKSGNIVREAGSVIPPRSQ